MRDMNPDVPVEVCALWAFRENKRLRAQLDMIVPYTKQLEKDREDLRRQLLKAQEQCAALRKTADRNANVVPIKPKNYRKALGHIKQGLNMLEAGKYADIVEDLDEQVIQEDFFVV